MSQHHSGNVQPSVDAEEHDHLPGKVAVKKVGQYTWKDGDWQRQSGIATDPNGHVFVIDTIAQSVLYATEYGATHNFIMRYHRVS